MLETSHSLIGASLAKLIPNPAIGLPLAIIVHFLCDLFPHWDLQTRKVEKTKLKIIIQALSDASVGIFLGWLIFKNQVDLPYLFLMMFFSQLPDWIEAPYLIFNWNFFPFASMKRLQSRLHYKLQWPWGFISQLIVVSALIIYALET